MHFTGDLEMDPESSKEAKRLCEYAYHGHVEDMKAYLDKVSSRVRYRGRTPLLSASMAPHNRGVKCVDFLLQQGVADNFSDSVGRSPMHWAAVKGNDKVVKVLYSHHPNLLNLRTSRGDTPLMWAAAVNNTEVVKLLIELGADLSARNIYGKSAADKAKKFHSWSTFIIISDTLNFILKQGQLSDRQKRKFMRKEEESKRLCILAWQCDLQQLEQLVSSENCNCRWRSLTPLMWVSRSARVGRRGATECASLLLQVGANPQLGDWQGRTAAFHVAKSGNVGLLELLPKLWKNLKDEETSSW